MITYGTSCPRVTLSNGVVLVSTIAPLSSGSSGMWLLKIWLVPGIRVPSSVTWRWWAVPALRAGTDAVGANSERWTSQNRVVPGMASPPLAGHSGTENAAVDASDIGRMICE